MGRTRTKFRELPNVGIELIASFKGKMYRAVIIKDKAARRGKAIRIGVINYPSMTAAAMAITNNPTNGWLFWKVK